MFYSDELIFISGVICMLCVCGEGEREKKKKGGGHSIYDGIGGGGFVEVINTSQLSVNSRTTLDGPADVPTRLTTNLITAGLWTDFGLDRRRNVRQNVMYDL